MKFLGSSVILTFILLGSQLIRLEASSLPISGPLEWEFKVFLDEKPIGNHEFSLTESAEGLLMETEARFDVKFLFFTAYTYRHNNVEIWDAAGLASIDSYTDANGDIYELNGKREGDAFVLRTRGGEEVLPGQLMTFAYWNPDILKQSRLLNSQTGEYERVDVVDRGVDFIEYRGQSIRARQFDLILDSVPVSVWYAVQDERWVALESVTESGRLLRYQPLRLPEAPVALALLDSQSN